MSAQGWVYWRSEPGVYTVGHYDATGSRVPESDHDTTRAAAGRVHYLNGGCAVARGERLTTLEKSYATMADRVDVLEGARDGARAGRRNLSKRLAILETSYATLAEQAADLARALERARAQHPGGIEGRIRDLFDELAALGRRVDAHARELHARGGK